MRLAALSPPAPLEPFHDCSAFDCGEPSLDQWLKTRARRNERSGASRTYVVCEGTRVLGYYCLAAGALTLEEAPKAMRRNMPDPLPVMVLGRLAVDRSCQNIGLGSALLLDATRRTLLAARLSGIVALLVQALSEPARRFYLSRGFIDSPVKSGLLCLVVATAERGLAEKPQ